MDKFNQDKAPIQNKAPLVEKAPLRESPLNRAIRTYLEDRREIMEPRTGPRKGDM